VGADVGRDVVSQITQLLGGHGGAGRFVGGGFGLLLRIIRRRDRLRGRLAATAGVRVEEGRGEKANEKRDERQADVDGDSRYGGGQN
jgi:hypothetical protein